MELDKIVILIMAIGFFGGLGYIAWKGRKEKRGGQPTSLITPNHAEGDSSNISQKKDHRISKS